MNSDSIHLFGPFTLDLARGSLTREGLPVHLRPQTYEVLKYLVENQGRLISKDKLIEEVWQGRAVTDGSLGKCIEEVREALGQDARKYVRNVRGRGYIFDTGSNEVARTVTVHSQEVDIVEVVVEEEVDDDGLSSQAKPSPELISFNREVDLTGPFKHSITKQITDQAIDTRSTIRTFSGRRVFFALMILVAGVVVILYARFITKPAQSISSIAILPFANESGDPNMEYLSDGIGEGIINSLSQIPSLRVMSRNSVFRYKGRTTDALSVGRELNVQAVLTGRVVQQGDVLSVNLELVNVADDTHIWGEQYNRKLTDLVSLQTEIARDVSHKLQVRFSGAEEQKLNKGFTENLEAYQLYLKARYHYFKLTQPEIRQAITFYEQAIAADPSYALAYAGLADAYRTLPVAGYAPSKEFFPQAKLAAMRALEIDDNLAEAHTVLGWVGFWFDWDWRAAENQLKRAIELSPNNSDAHRAYGQLLSSLARHDEAVAEAKQSRELDPLAFINHALEAQVLFYAGRNEEAVARLQNTIATEPNFWIAHNVLGRVYLGREMYPEAITELRKASELSSDATEPATQLAYALAKSGQRDEAQTILKRFTSPVLGHYVPAYDVAMIYNGLDDRRNALDYLEKSLTEREVQMTFLKVDKRWDLVRHEPRFQELARRVGLPD